MIPGLKDPKEFIRGCFNSTIRCASPCNLSQACCPIKDAEGLCQWACKTTVDPKPKAGQCPGSQVAGWDGVFGGSDPEMDVDADLGLDGFDDDEEEEESTEFGESIPQRKRWRPRRPMRWIKGFCRFAIMNGRADPIQCRHDGDCAGTQKCCSPKPNPDNFLEMCNRQCTTV